MKYLSHGFHVGINNITITKCSKWVDFSFYDLEPLCNYLILRGFDIVDYAHNWFKVKLSSDKDVDRLYSYVVKFAKK